MSSEIAVAFEPGCENGSFSRWAIVFLLYEKKKHIRNPVWEDTQLRETDILLDMFSESVLNISKPWAINTVLWGNRITTLLERFGVRQLTLISEKPSSVKGIYLQP